MPVNNKNKKVEIAYLSTYYENIGDDFIRLGISYLVNKLLNSNVNESHFSKSNGLSYFFNKSKLTHQPRWQMNNRQKWMLDRFYFLLLRLGAKNRFASKIQKNDFVILAGTPLFFFTKGKYTFLQNMNWPKDFYQEIRENYPNKKILCIGAGSIYEFDPSVLEEKYPQEFNFLQKLVKEINYIAVRDSKTKKLLDTASGSDTIEQLACPSIFASRKYQIKRFDNNSKKRTVVLSYSEESANIDDNMSNALIMRRKALDYIIKSLSAKDYNLALFAHNKIDDRLHATLKKQYPNVKLETGTSKDFLNLVSKIDLLIAWRVHGAMGAASVGCPAILFKTDSRSSTTEIFDLKVVDDRTTPIEDIMSIINEQLERGFIVNKDNISVVDKLEEQYLNKLEKEFTV